MLTILLIIATVFLVLAVIGLWTGPVPTPIPASMAAWFRSVFRGSIGLTLWRAFLIVVFASVALGLILGLGMVGSFIAALILTTLLADTVQKWIIDLWNAEFYQIEV